MTTTDTDTARDQAKAQLENIQAMVAQLEHAQECDGDLDDCDLDGDVLFEALNNGVTDVEEYHDEDEARERIQEDPLSVQVRSQWVTPGGDEMEAAEFEILLTTGGPAVRIIGELDGYGNPDHARLQYQDWGTPWTELLDPRDMTTLIAYAQNFYFGE